MLTDSEKQVKTNEELKLQLLQSNDSIKVIQQKEIQINHLTQELTKANSSLAEFKHRLESESADFATRFKAMETESTKQSHQIKELHSQLSAAAGEKEALISTGLQNDSTIKSLRDEIQQLHQTKISLERDVEKLNGVSDFKK